MFWFVFECSMKLFLVPADQEPKHVYALGIKLGSFGFVSQ